MQERIRKLLGAAPFVPFTVVMSSGEQHPVRHPEHALLTKHWLIVVDADQEDEVHDLYLLHVTEIKRTLPASA